MSELNLYQKLLLIQKEVDSFTKDKKGFDYKYTTGNQVLNKIRPLMNELGLLLKQEVLSVENDRMDYTTSKGKSKSEILSSVKQRFTWIDSTTGEVDVNEFHANGMNDWDKGLGSALTYAERYFLLKFFHVPTDEDDPDTRQGQSSSPHRRQNGRSKKALKPGSKVWDSAVQAIAQGKATIEQAKKKYAISTKDEKTMKEQVLSLQEEVHA